MIKVFPHRRGQSQLRRSLAKALSPLSFPSNGQSVEHVGDVRGWERRRREVRLTEEEGSQVENLRLRILQASGPGLTSQNTPTPQTPVNNAQWSSDLGPSDPVCQVQ